MFSKKLEVWICSGIGGGAEFIKIFSKNQWKAIFKKFSKILKECLLLEATSNKNPKTVR